MQTLAHKAKIQSLIDELVLHPELRPDSNIVTLTSNELANLLLEISKKISSGRQINEILEDTVSMLGEIGIAERVLLFQSNQSFSKAYLTNYWESSYVEPFNPIGFKVDISDPPFTLFSLSKNQNLQIENFSRFFSLPNYLFKNQYKALLMKLKTKSMLVALGSSDKARIVLNIQYSTREVVWSNEIEKALQSIVDQLALAIERHTDIRIKENLEKSVAKLKEKALLEREELLRQFASDVHDLPCSIIPKLRCAITNKDFEESEKLIGELHHTLRQLINEYIVPDMNLLGFVGNIHQFLNGFKKSFTGNLIVNLPEEELDFSQRNAIELYKVIKEWFCNISKHASASEVRFSLKKLNELYFTVVVSDNGNGFNVEDTKNYGYGLYNIKRRLADINAKYKITSQIGKGTTLKIQVYLK